MSVQKPKKLLDVASSKMDNQSNGSETTGKGIETVREIISD